MENNDKYKNKQTNEVVTLIAKDVTHIGYCLENCGVNLYKFTDIIGVENDYVIIINSFNEYIIMDSLYFEQIYEKIS